MFISQAWAQGAGGAGGDFLVQLFPLVLIFVVFYFLLIRPQAKRQKEHRKMVEALTKGDEIITMGGMAGRIADIGENFALVEVADGMKVKIRRTAVESVLPKGTLQEL